MRELLWKKAHFCGVEVFTDAMMSNHFHLLVRAPENVGVDGAVSDAKLLDRAALLREDGSMGVLQSSPLDARSRSAS